MVFRISVKPIDVLSIRAEKVLFNQQQPVHVMAELGDYYHGA